MAPSHKVKIVEAYRMNGNVVAMTGDGVNDAPALKIADIGIAMGKGADACKECAEMILVDSNFSTIVAAIEEGKSIYNNIQNFLRFQLSTSISALSIVAFVTLFNHKHLPFNPMQILWVNIIMDGPPAQATALEPRSESVTKSPPRDPTLPVITPFMIKKILMCSFLMTLGTLHVFFSYLDPNVSEHQLYASTMAFTTFVMFQMFNAVNCRSARESVFKIGLFSNKFFTVAIFLAIFMQVMVVYVPLLQYIFETTALSTSDFLYCCLLPSSIFILDELYKRFC